MFHVLFIFVYLKDALICRVKNTTHHKSMVGMLSLRIDHHHESLVRSAFKASCEIILCEKYIICEYILSAKYVVNQWNLDICKVLNKNIIMLRF